MAKKLSNKKRQSDSIRRKKTDRAALLHCHDIKFDDLTKVHPKLKAILGYCLFKAATLLRTRYEEALRPLQVHVHHMAIVSLLEDESQINQNQLCEQLGIDKASMVKLIDHLEKQNFVERLNSAEDRRVKFLHLTSSGRQLLKQARQIRNYIEGEFLKKITLAEAQSLRQVLPRLIEP